MTRGAAIAAAVLLALVPISRAEVACERVVAVGDLHGGYDAFVSILLSSGLIDANKRWIDDEACLVQLGDVVDRGDRWPEIMALIDELARQAPGRFHALLGNHEAMNLLGDWRYVTQCDIERFSEEDESKERRRAYREFERLPIGRDLDEEACRRAFDERFPPGWFARRAAFVPKGRYGAWILERPLAVRLQRTLFVHGGLTPADARLGPEELERRTKQELLEILELKQELIERGWLSSLLPFDAIFPILSSLLDTLQQNTSIGRNYRVGPAWRLLELADALAIRVDGPLWHRDFANGVEAEVEPALDEVLWLWDVDRIVVAHTPQLGGRIGARFGGRAYLIDTGIGPHYGGHASALELRDGGVRALYPGGAEVLVRSEPAIERLLREGRVVASEPLVESRSGAMKVLLDRDGQQLEAAFKIVDVRKLGVAREGRFAPEIMFTDTYRHDRAAYLLDRLLGLNMVPVTVLREIEGQRGAVIDWVSGAITEGQRRAKALQPPDARRLHEQRELMKVFDALILNTDRSLNNELITTRDWKLHLIDHSRSFRLAEELPPGFEDEPISISRRLASALESLTPGELSTLFGDLLSGLQLRSLLARRDLILEKIARDRARFGDALVFHEDSRPFAKGSAKYYEPGKRR
ncbi:MAG: metallophosphoesterase [Acidobacteriota bacterium]|nr:MAG: metallophosphoesterase [Acidobacteriota bacterium]